MLPDKIPQLTAQNHVSLRLGEPDLTTLATEELRSTIQTIMNTPDCYRGLQYGPDEGNQSLITFLLEKISREYGIPVGPANMMLVAGATHAVDMLTRLYARPGSVVLIEAPTYADAIHVFRDYQVELYAIPMDNDGLITSELREQLAQLQSKGKRPSFLYTVPTFHNPTGTILCEARRLEVIELARQYGFIIVEDDVYRDLSFESPVPASLYAMARGKQVCSIGSFSKTLAPGLRLGWLLAPEEVIQRCVNCGTTQMGGGASPFSAHIVAEYCRSGHWEKHIVQLRSLYRSRRDLMLAALKRYMPSEVDWTHPNGGFFIWLNLPENISAQHIKHLALQAGVSVATGEAYFLNPSDGEHYLRLAYSSATANNLETAVRILAQVVDRLGKQ